MTVFKRTLFLTALLLFPCGCEDEGVGECLVEGYWKMGKGSALDVEAIIKIDSFYFHYFTYIVGWFGYSYVKSEAGIKLYPLDGSVDDVRAAVRCIGDLLIVEWSDGTDTLHRISDKLGEVAIRRILEAGKNSEIIIPRTYD